MAQKTEFKLLDGSLETIIEPREEPQVQISVVFDKFLDITVCYVALQIL